MHTKASLALGAAIAAAAAIPACAPSIEHFETALAEARPSAPTHARPDSREHSNRSPRASAGETRQERPPTIDADSSLAECLRCAALSSPRLEAAFNRWRAALERVPQVGALPDPRFTYGVFINEVETRVGPQRQRVAISQTFPWFGELRLRESAAARAAEAERQRFEAARLALFFEVREAYFDLFYLRRAIALTEENVELVKQFERVARARYKVAEAGHPDVIRAQVELGELEDRLARLRDRRRPLAARLNAAMGREPSAPTPWPKNIPDARLDAQRDQILAWMNERNPELLALEKRTERRRAQSRLARTDFYPDVTLGLTYIETDEAIDPSVGESGDDPLLASVSINLPIWREKYSAGVREAVADRLASAQTKDDRADRLAAEVEKALFDHEDAQRRVALFRDALIPKANESLRASLTGFQAGEVPFLDLLDAERTLLDFQLSLARARADRATSLAKLEMLVGRGLPTTSSPSEHDNKEKDQ